MHAGKWKVQQPGKPGTGPRFAEAKKKKTNQSMSLETAFREQLRRNGDTRKDVTEILEDKDLERGVNEALQLGEDEEKEILKLATMRNYGKEVLRNLELTRVAQDTGISGESPLEKRHLEVNVETHKNEHEAGAKLRFELRTMQEIGLDRRTTDAAHRDVCSNTQQYDEWKPSEAPA